MQEDEMSLKRLQQIRGSLDRAYDQWKPFFQEVAQAFDPNRQRFDLLATNEHHRYNQNIIDPTVGMCVRTAAGGFFSGITNPSVPWIKLGVPDKDRGENVAAKRWLFEVSQLILSTLAQSNFYDVAPMLFKDFVMYSTLNGFTQEDTKTDIRFYHQPMGTYRIANDERGMANIWSRSIMLTAQQIMVRYGFDKLPHQIKNTIKSGDYHTMFKVSQLIMPRKSFDPTKRDKLNKPFASYEWLDECGDDEHAILDVGGSRLNPAITSRWEQLGNDCYGSFAPGMLGLGAANGLQVDSSDKFLGQKMMLNPPLNMPLSMQNSNTVYGPGARFYTGQGDAVTSASNVQYPINYATQSIQDTRQLLKSVFFNDLFMMISDVQRTGVTATEIAEKKEEKLLMLGPVLSRVNEEMLDPVVMQTFYQLDRHGKLPPVPDALQGQPLTVEYISMLHQAQALTQMTAIEKSVSFVGNLVGVKQDIIDNINLDQACRKYFEIAGLDPNMTTTESDMQQTRQARQQQQQMQANAQMAQPAMQSAQAAKLLSETDSGGQNALDLMRSNLGQMAPAMQ